jgi:hypothetical protein
MPASGRHSLKGHRGEKRQKNTSLHICCEFQPGFRSQWWNKTKNVIKLKWGQSVAWSDFGELFLQAAGAFSAPFHALDLTPELRGL